ncbi:hypothetical protein PIB30_042045 [Stylosanthes scabra]|uniref:Uncharacterized protein n=1 Tax=Stylosanthes scabra TaxID=79078 RepID=A0ABU6WH76_9FABA|nr:hypothetical protein [Stylosanthes scabra]
MFIINSVSPVRLATVGSTTINTPDSPTSSILVTSSDVSAAVRFHFEINGSDSATLYPNWKITRPERTPTRAAIRPAHRIRASTRPDCAVAPLHFTANSSLPCQSEIATCHLVC